VLRDAGQCCVVAVLRGDVLAADTVRCLTQAALAVVLLGDGPGLWMLVRLVGLWGAAEALFSPALNALVPKITQGCALSDANALLGVATSGASIAGPAPAGLLTAAAGASCVLALDAANYPRRLSVRARPGR
jgi:hypothetical protein